MNPGERRLAAALVCVVTVVAFEAMSVATILPDVEDDLGGLTLYGWVFSAFTLSSLIGIVAAGWWCDRHRPADALAAALGLFVIGLVVGGAATSMGMLVGGRVLQGLGAGIVPAVVYVCIGRGFPEEQRPRVFALAATAWVVPSLIGPAVAAFVSEHASWRWVFLGLVPITVVIGAASLPAVYRLGAVVNEDPSTSPIVLPTIGLTLGAAVTLASLELSPAIAVPAVVIGLAATGYAFTHLTPPGTLRARPGLPAAVLLRGMLTFAFFGIDAYISLALVDVRGTSTVFAGVVLAVASFSWTAGSWVQARWVTRVGPRPFVRTGFLLVVVASSLLVSTMSEAVPVGVAIIGWILGGLGMGFAYAPISAATLSSAEEGHEGAATASLQLSDSLGMSFGTGIGGALITAFGSTGDALAHGVRAVWLGMAGVALMGAVLAPRLPASVSREPAPV